IIYVPVYGYVASKLSRQQFLTAVILFFIGCIQLFCLSSWIGVPYLGFIFYVWVGIFSLTTIAQFWSFANEAYAKPEGDRLFPLIAVGSAAGAPVGAALAASMFGFRIDPYTMMEIAAGILLVHLGLYRIASRRVAKGSDKAEDKPIKSKNGFALVFQSRYLRLIALLLVLLNIVNTLGEYILGSSLITTANGLVVSDPSFDKEAYIGAFYGNYFFWTNVAAVVLQAFVVSRLVKKFGMSGVLLALPLVALVVYGGASFGAGLPMLLYMKIAENSTDYSIMNTAKQMLWLPTKREEKYKAKQAIDTFFVRMGDMIAAGMVFVGTTVLSAGTAGFAMANVGFVLLAIGVAILLLREYRRLTGMPASEPVPSTE
ncbi:MAG: Npt1/Npt2 family nucleotide transporter, partial [Pyrinomonadaceae bacterium]